MKKILFKSLSVLSAAILLVACEKAELKDGGGKTLFKFVAGGPDPLVLALNTNPATETIKIADVLRDASNNADLKQEATVTISNSQAFLDAYNADNGTEYVLPPSSAYSVSASSGVTVSGNTWTLTMAAGEFSRAISVVLDKSQLDLSKSYAFGLEITQSTVGEPSAGTGHGIVNVLIKNDYDGAYEVTGSMTDHAAALGGLFPMNYHLITTGANSVAGYDPDYWVDYFIPILSGADVSGYGSFSPIFNFNANGEITSVVNIYGQPAGNGRYAQIDPSGINKWDPGTRAIDVKFFMFMPSSVPLPNPRVSFDWHMEYLGSR
jgi:hypothetical protein